MIPVLQHQSALSLAHWTAWLRCTHCMLDVKVLGVACKGLLTSVSILKPLPKPCKVFEAPYDLCVVFLILW